MVVGTLFEFDFQKYVASRKSLVEARLAEYLPVGDPPLLWEAMRYSVLAGGKRIRALICLSTAEAVVGANANKPLDEALEGALPCACAIELIHAMSLIHDDLPVMDNDDLRRGRPTNHKVYGEAMALLAGDALLPMASEILVTKTSGIDPYILLNVAGELTRASGAQGMVGGQVLDMISEGKTKKDDRFAATRDDGSLTESQLLENIHKRKTGALITFAAWSGARLLGATPAQLQSFTTYGQALGLAFQVADDLLDVTGDSQTLGKTPGKDQAADKLTYVKLFGVEQSRAKLKELGEQGKAALSDLNLPEQQTAPLLALINYAISRSH